jgi:hypothetical protein
MAQNLLITIDNTYRKVKDGFITIDGVYRRFKKAYITIGGVYRPCFNDNEIVNYGSISSLSQARFNLVAATAGNYAIFAGGDSGHNGQYSITSGVVEAYNTSFTKTTLADLNYPRYSSQAVTLNDCAIFEGGRYTDDLSNDFPQPVIDLYDSSLTNKYKYDSTNHSRYYGAGTSFNNYALFGGGKSNSSNTSSSYLKSVVTVDTSLTTTKITDLGRGRYSLGAATTGDHVIFAGGMIFNGSDSTGYYSKDADAYDRSFTKISVPNLPSFAQTVIGMNLGNNAVFDASGSLVVYNNSLTVSNLTTGVNLLPKPCMTSIDGLGIIVAEQVVYTLDASLTFKKFEDRKNKGYQNAMTTLGNNALVGGGWYGGNTVRAVDVYKLK